MVNNKGRTWGPDGAAGADQTHGSAKSRPGRRRPQTPTNAGASEADAAPQRIGGGNVAGFTTARRESPPRSHQQHESGPQRACMPRHRRRLGRPPHPHPSGTERRSISRRRTAPVQPPAEGQAAGEDRKGAQAALCGARSESGDTSRRRRGAGRGPEHVQLKTTRRLAVLDNRTSPPKKNSTVLAALLDLGGRVGPAHAGTAARPGPISVAFDDDTST